MSSEVSMGLRANEARQILINNKYHVAEYAHANRTMNDGSAYLYASALFFGGFMSAALHSAASNPLSTWINYPSFKPVYNPIVMAIGAIAMLALFAGCAIREDRKEIHNVKSINANRKKVMDVIDNNYTGIKFHAPLDPEHLATLDDLIDRKTKKELLKKLNVIQMKFLKNTQNNNAVLNETEIHWQNKISLELKAWEDLKESLRDNNKNSIIEAYEHCKTVFEDQNVVDTFVEANITINNLQTVHDLSPDLKIASEHFYSKNESEISKKSFFTS